MSTGISPVQAALALTKPLVTSGPIIDSSHLPTAPSHLDALDWNNVKQATTLVQGRSPAALGADLSLEPIMAHFVFFSCRTVASRPRPWLTSVRRSSDFLRFLTVTEPSMVHLASARLIRLGGLDLCCSPRSLDGGSCSAASNRRFFFRWRHMSAGSEFDVTVNLQE